MKNSTTQILRCFFMLSLLFTTFSCEKLDNLTNPDNFNFFDDDQDRELRRYTFENPNANPIIQIVVDRNNLENVKLAKDIKKVCDYTKLPMKVTSLEDWNATLPIFNTTRVLCIYDTKKVTDESVDRILEFVSKGGTLFLPYSCEDIRFSYLIGLKPSLSFEIDTTSKGFKATSPILPNMVGTNFYNDIVLYGLDRSNFKDDITILATAQNNSSYPAITVNDIGLGKVAFFNSSSYYTKMDRGLLFAGILNGLEGIPYPIANTSTVFLDDFPSPLYDAIREPIASEMKMTLTDFVYKVWWPDMIKVADDYGLKYTAMTTFDYDNNIQPPFLFNQWDFKKVKIDGKLQVLSNYLCNSVIENKHELGFHGYNHVSLLKHDWKNPDFMVTALNSAEKKWKINNFGHLPVTYVPPSNDIDKIGVKQLKKGMPSIKFMCSIYLGDLEDGGDRDFDFDPYEPELFDYPRTSSGFYMEDNNYYALNSIYLYTGIWTHFVHPDDVYQIKDKLNISQGDYGLRNYDNLGWRNTKGRPGEAMLPKFRKLIGDLKKAYPKMRFADGKEAGYIVNDWRANKFKHTAENGNYIVSKLNPEDSYYNDQYWFMYGSSDNDGKISKQLNEEGVSFSKTPFLEGFMYSIYTEKPSLKMIDLMEKNIVNPQLIRNVVQAVKGDFARYNSNINEIVNQLYLDEHEAEIQKKLVEELKSKALAEPSIDAKTWNELAKYMSWDEKEKELWEMLENHVEKYPTKNNIMYSKSLSKIVDYPTDAIRHKWLLKQIEANPNDKGLLNEYLADYDSPENINNVRNIIEKMVAIDKSPETMNRYLEFLLANDIKKAKEVLATIEPSKDYEQNAAAITYLYADDKEYKKAYEWSKFTKQIEFKTKMYWLSELKDFNKLEKEYNSYIVKSPDDYKAKAYMSNLYNENNKFKNSWVVANSLPNVPEKDTLKDLLNKAVIYEERTMKLDLADNHPDLFHPHILKKILKDERRTYGDFIATNSVIETNKHVNSALKNTVSYNTYDKKLGLHSFAGVFNKMYEIQLETKDDKYNITHDVYGIQYQYTSPVIPEKLNYFGRTRFEYSTENKYFGQLVIGANLSKDKNYKSAELRIAPVETGPSYSKNIYRFQLNTYQDYYFFGFINGSLSLEGDYYTPSSRKDAKIITNDCYEGSATLKLIYDKGEDKKYKLLPFIESSYSQASINSEFKDFVNSGYPFWMIDRRLFYGGGLGFKMGKEEDDFNMRVEGAWFKDDYTPSFSRATGNVSYQIFDFVALTTQFEIYFQDKFYSNAIQFGIKHNLKTRRKK